MRVFVINAVYHGCFQENICFDFHSTQSCCSIGREERASCSATKDDNSTFFQVADGFVPNVRFCNLLHADGSLYPNINAQSFHRICNRKGIHGCCKHPDVVRSGTIHISGGTTTPEISAADNNADFCPSINTLFNAGTNFIDHIKIQTSLLIASECFSAQFQNHSFVL